MDSRPTRQTDSLTEQLNKWGVCEEMRLETGGEFRVWLGHGIFSTYCQFLSFYSNIEINVQFLMSILNTRCVQSMYDQVYFWKKNLKNTFRNPSLLLLGFGPPTQDTGRQGRERGKYGIPRVWKERKIRSRGRVVLAEFTKPTVNKWNDGSWGKS